MGDRIEQLARWLHGSWARWYLTTDRGDPTSWGDLGELIQAGYCHVAAELLSDPPACVSEALALPDLVVRIE